VPTSKEDLELAQKLADLADKISLPRFRSLDLVVETKPDLSPVSDADKSVELALREELARERPEDGILGEEYGVTGNHSRQWIIDPIDGTANFIRKVPIWASLIALAVDGKPVVSVVSAPALGLRWWASPDLGSYKRELDGSVSNLEVSKVSRIEDSSLSYNNLQLWQSTDYLESLLNLTSRVWRTRAYGDFWSYMLLAEGALDVVAEHDLKIYDIAALVPIVEQAGGEFSDIAGELGPQSSSVLATNSLLHEQIQAAFQESRA
jgi:histidinol-phosphatase